MDFKNKIRVPPEWRTPEGDIEEPSPILPCSTGKKQFRDELDAKIALARIAQRNAAKRVDFEPTRWYRCPECRWYHLTSKRGKR
jgi:hypothetical protein